MAAAATTTTGDNGDEEDWLAGLTVSRATTVSIRARDRVACALARLAEHQQRQQDRKDQVQVKMRPQTSVGQQPARPNHNQERQAEEESSSFCLLSERWAQPATTAPSERSPNGNPVMSANVKSRHNLRRRRRGRCRASKVGQSEAREAKEEEENNNTRCSHYKAPRRTRAHLAELRGARGGKSRLVSMWPSWRQIVLISFLSLAFASLLSTMLPRAASPSFGSSCLLFKHCHALSVSSSGQPSGNGVSGARGNKSSVVASDKALATSKLAGATHSSSTETPRALRLNQKEEQAPTTTPATSALRAPTTTVWPSTSSLGDETSSSKPAGVDTDDKQPHSSTRLPSSQAAALISQSMAQQQRQSSRPLSPIKHWVQRQQAKLTQLSNSNETNADSFASNFKQTSHNKDNNGRDGQQQQLQHFLLADNYRAGGGQDDNNGSRRASLAGGQATSSLQSLQPLASSITRADLEPGRLLAESPAAIAGSHLESNGINNSTSSNGGGTRRQQYSSRGGQSGANSATFASSVPNSSAASALKLIASPALTLPSDQGGRQQSRPARRRLNSTSQIGATRPQTPWMPPSSRTEESSTEAPLATGANVSAAATTTTPATILLQTQPPPPPPPPPPPTTTTSGLELGELEEQLLSRASGRSSTPAAHLQPAATRRQFLVPAGLPHSLLQSAVREAINDLMVSTGEQIFSAASAARPLVLRPHSIVSALANGQFNLHQQQQQRLPAGFSSSQFGADLQGQSQRPSTTGKQQEGIGKTMMSIASSASAPSISLPPLSHLLSPRNPFRLFASSSAPAATRYRANFLQSSSSNKPASSSNRWLLGSSRAKQQQQPQQQQPQQQQLLKQTQTNFATFANMDPAAGEQQQPFPVPVLPVSFFQSPSGQLPKLDEQASSSTPNLYAHSHSAHQLEQLVRAASQSSGLQSPPILPAIVSAPAGAIPGFYIPAIESESESQVSELRHGEQLGSAGNSLISSKIPGTDYILHPDEVRAMIGIGELAWRAQQQQDQLQRQRTTNAGVQMKGEGRQASNLAHRQVAATNSQQQQSSESEKRPNWNAPINHYQIGWAPENHAENMRDYSYIDAQMRRENMQAAHSLISQQQHPDQQHHNQQQQQQMMMMANNSSDELAQQLAKHFGQNKLKAFPAIIRVNDQDYVHWPLIKISTADASSFDSSDHFRQATENHNQMANSFQQNARLIQVNQEHHHHHQQQQLHKQPLANQESRLSSAAAPALNSRPPRQQQPGQQLEMANSAVVNQQQQQGQADFEHSPVRLATQLTPNEIRQVEDSIIEALIMSQTLQHQQKVMEQLAANQNAPVFVAPPGREAGEFRWPTGDTNQQQPKKERTPRFRNGFFGRRRRRNLANQPQQKPDGAGRPTVAAAESLLQFFPLLNASEPPLRVLGPLMRHDSLEDSMTSLAAAGEPQVVVGEPRRPQRHLPVVMADQETNKPSLTAEYQASPLSSLDTPLLSESSEARASILSPSAATLISAGRRAMRPSEKLAAAATTQSLVFGSRVSASKGIQEQQPGRQQQPSSFSQALDKEASTTRGRQASLIRGPLYDDDEDSNQQGGHNFADQQRQTVDRQHRQRVNVDWPGMVSDADYFPRPAGNQAKRGEGEQSSTGLQQQVSSTKSLHVGDNLVGAGSGVGIWPGKSFVTSQLKLQFAQDYQAREGVPIYNNNVRVAGGLERQRSIASQSRELVSPLEVEHGALGTGEDPEEIGEFEDDKTGAGDLLQRGSSESRGAEPKVHQIADAKRSNKGSREPGRRRPSSRAAPQFETDNHKLNNRVANHSH